MDYKRLFEKSGVFYKKSMFFTFFLKNIWPIQKKVVPLHTKSKNKHYESNQFNIRRCESILELRK